MFWLFFVFFIFLAISATPLLGSLEVRWSLEIMIGLFVFFIILGWGLFIFYPAFS